MVTNTPKSLEKLRLYKIWENSYLESKLYKLFRKREQIFQWYYQHLINLFVRHLENNYWETPFEKWFLESSLKIMNEGEYAPKNLARVEAKARGVYNNIFVLKIRIQIQKIRESRKELLKPRRVDRPRLHCKNFYKIEMN